MLAFLRRAKRHLIVLASRRNLMSSHMLSGGAQNVSYKPQIRTLSRIKEKCCLTKWKPTQNHQLHTLQVPTKKKKKIKKGKQKRRVEGATYNMFISRIISIYDLKTVLEGTSTRYNF